ncbi:MAG: L,D-transpeptidase family protein, partial [Hyphomicrobiaceae bacterium]
MRHVFYLALAVGLSGIVAGPTPVEAQTAPADRAATIPPQAGQEPAAPAVEPPPPPPPPADPVAAAILQRAADVREKMPPRERQERAELAAFYTARSGEPLWLSAGVFTPRAEQTAAEIRRADDWGLRAADFDLPAIAAGARATDLAAAELQMSLAVLKYARHARGGRMDPTQLSNYIDRTPPLPEPKAVLEGIAAAAEPDAYMRGLH